MTDKTETLVVDVPSDFEYDSKTGADAAKSALYAEAGHMCVDFERRKLPENYQVADEVTRETAKLLRDTDGVTIVWKADRAEGAYRVEPADE
jgi:5'-deoxynucleotidase YfbR-like HD superfamily hydrolase